MEPVTTARPGELFAASVHATPASPASPAPPRRARLARVVAINEDIKQVVHRAFAINLMALNAILAARSAGEAAAGFGVVASEMRRLSIALEESMRCLRQLTDRLLDTTTRATRHERVCELLDRVSGSSAPTLAGVLDACDRARAAYEQQIVDHCKALARDVDNAMRASRLGDSLAHLAKIEASWAASHRSGLSTVAGELAQALQSILPVLGGLERKLEDFRS